MALLRPMFALFLVLALAWGSVLSAMARYEMEGATALTICGHHGNLTMQIDASGQPVKMSHDCPHCMAAAAMALLAAPPVLPGLQLRSVTIVRPDLPASPALWQFRPSARGPPDWI